MEDKTHVIHTGQNQSDFWRNAELTETYPRDHARNKLQRCKFDIQFGRGKFRRRQRWTNKETGERRETITIEI